VKAAVKYLEERGRGAGAVTYRLRDWLISRQRYWGAPIPIVYCAEHGQVPVPEEQLPLELPDDVEWLPTGQSPLKLHPTWAVTTCPICEGPAERDTDTMDTFMCSSWYHLRYLSPDYDDGPFEPAEYDYWMPVDTYTGGAEHATMHLIYTRFFHKACRDMGITKGDEPMLQLRNQGQILGPDGQRMSKSRGNVVDPDAEVARYGADTVRAYMAFGYDWSEGGPWSDQNIQGPWRWLGRMWNIAQTAENGATPDAGAVRELQRAQHVAIRDVGDDLEAFKFNTVVSSLMEYTNALYRLREATEGSAEWREAVDALLLLSAPIAPHITEELWAARGNDYSIHQQAWPAYDAALTAMDEVEVVVQVNGKVRDHIMLAPDVSEEVAVAAAVGAPRVAEALGGRAPKKVVYVAGRLVNVVV
jgi:leucyl-tRNA synthetase